MRIARIPVESASNDQMIKYVKRALSVNRSSSLTDVVNHVSAGAVTGEVTAITSAVRNALMVLIGSSKATETSGVYSPIIVLGRPTTGKTMAKTMAKTKLFAHKAKRTAKAPRSVNMNDLQRAILAIESLMTNRMIGKAKMMASKAQRTKSPKSQRFQFWSGLRPVSSYEA